MSDQYFQDETFEELDSLTPGEYEACTFLYCQLGKYDLSNYIFRDCEFQNCDLSTAKLRETTLSEVQFLQCKLMGIDFSECRKFSFSVAFADCNLNFASFHQVKMGGTEFIRCSLEECDLAATELSNASFEDCNFNGSMFDGTILEKADFGDSRNFLIDPEQNRIKGAIFPQHGLEGLLYRHEIEVRS